MKVYLDYNASAPLRPEVLALMRELLAHTGNASSVHGFGRMARTLVEKAREQAAALAGAHANQVIFTAGATEANNMVLQAFRGSRILISATDHPSVREAAPDADLIPVTPDGLVDEDVFIALLDKGGAPALVSIMAVNNETGVIQNVGRLAKIAKKKFPAIHVHTDAVQGAGRIALDFPAWHIDYMSLSAHKLGGPQGAGALVTAPGAKPVKLLHGGGQEKRQRAGTENVAAIAGFGLAAELAQNNIAAFQRIAALRDRMENELRRAAPALAVHGHAAPRVANTSLFSLPGIAAQTQIMALDLAGIAVSSGSACSSGAVKSSQVLRAMGVADNAAASALRVSLGPATTAAEIDDFIRVWSEMAARIGEKGKAHA
jgi:cysteine desulfurase